MSRSFFVGAGFSAAAGLPVATELFSLVRAAIRRKYGSDNHFERDLHRYILYEERCENRTIDPAHVDLEELLGFLDAEHYLGLKGKDTWSSDGNESQLMIRSATAQVLHSRTPSILPESYTAFARGLSLHDWIYSFNYDTIIEQALDAEGVRYRLFLQRYVEVQPLSGTVDDSVDEVVLLKMHGSIDWFDRTSYDELCNVIPNGYKRDHPIFGPNPRVNIESIVEGPRQKDDPLNQISRVRDLHKLMNEPSLAVLPSDSRSLQF